MIKAIGDKIIVKQEKREVGSIIVDDHEFLLKPVGIVISVGDDVVGVSFDEVVYFNELAGQRIEYEGVEYVVLNFRDILAKIC